MMRDYPSYLRLCARYMRQYKHKHRCCFLPHGAPADSGTGMSHLRGFTNTDTPHSLGLLWTGDGPIPRPVPDITQHSQETDIHVPSGIRTHNPSKRAVADLRLRLHGHRDRQTQLLMKKNTVGER
jgi:hypothetical protein